jgi:hypothetical protein
MCGLGFEAPHELAAIPVKSFKFAALDIPLWDCEI